MPDMSTLMPDPEPAIAIECPPEEDRVRHVLADGQRVATVRYGTVPYGYGHSPNPNLTSWHVFDAGGLPILLGDTGFHEEAPQYATEDTPEARNFWLDRMAEGVIPTPEAARALLAEYAVRRANPTTDQLRRLAAFWADTADRLGSLNRMTVGGVDRARGMIGPHFSTDLEAADMLRDTLDRLERTARDRSACHTQAAWRQAR